ncbi:MAG: carboxypeptidase regulatory-like domain-containing protein [Bacteroidia bacterium]|nr:carboxypeptidase regulatory-like domain-containing protein [Bacteroidia bacterium]
MRKFKIIRLLLLAMMPVMVGLSQDGYGEIRGTIKNNEKQTVPFATVKITRDKELVGGVQTDENGNYKYKPLAPGNYDVIVFEPGHQSKQINGVKVTPNQPTYLNIKLELNTLETVTVTYVHEEDYSQSGCNSSMYSMASIDGKDLLQSASFERGNLMTAIPVLVSDVVVDKDGEMHFRGSRSDANGFYVDGIRVMDMSAVPGLAIENLTVFSGGVPAMYGDVTSGVIILTTKSYFSGIREKRIRQARMQEKREAKKLAEEEAKEKADGVIYN